MKREYELRRRLRSLDAMGDAVSAMKSVSAHHFREARAGVPPARQYREGVERILGWAEAELVAGSGPVGLLVVGAELGFCGGYNARVVALASERREQLGPGPTLCVGRRAAALLGRRGVVVDGVYGAPTSAAGITDVLLRVAEDIGRRYVTARLSGFEIVSSEFGGVGADAPRATRLLPLAPARAARPRAPRYGTPAELARAATREAIFITLYERLLDALASEHGARLVATQAAEEWLRDRARTLHRHLAATRREASTQEILEISAGARARPVAGR